MHKGLTHQLTHPYQMLSANLAIELFISIFFNMASLVNKPFFCSFADLLITRLYVAPGFPPLSLMDNLLSLLNNLIFMLIKENEILLLQTWLRVLVRHTVKHEW